MLQICYYPEEYFAGGNCFGEKSIISYIFSEFERKIFGRVVKTAFYVSSNILRFSEIFPKREQISASIDFSVNKIGETSGKKTWFFMASNRLHVIDVVTNIELLHRFGTIASNFF